jgi:hypothetical protein
MAETVVFAFIGLVAVLAVAAILTPVVIGLIRWNRNNKAPQVTSPAVVVTKRQETSGGSRNTSVSTQYFVTFEIQGGDRLEIPMHGEEFGTLVEGDRGRLTYQGTRYKGFARTPRDL